MIPVPAQPPQVVDLIRMTIDTVRSKRSKFYYRRALEEFFNWTNGRSVNRVTVNEYRTFLLENGTGLPTINIALSAIRKMIHEAYLAEWVPELVYRGIKDIPGVGLTGKRAGNWITKEQCRTLLDAPPAYTTLGIRDRAMLAVFLGCALRREEVSHLEFKHFQQRDGRWCIVDILGKGLKMRTIPAPAWTVERVQAWVRESGITEGRLFTGGSQVYRRVVLWAAKCGLDITPHDLRRTFAKLSRSGGSQIEQIQMSLGHSSISTTQIYLGSDQDFADAPADRLGIF